MDTPKSIELLADKKIIEAECLFNNEHYDAAYYLAGYAVELFLKAKICLTLKIDDFYDFGGRARFGNEDSITKPYKVHNFEQLLIFAALREEHKMRLNDIEYKDTWMILELWKEDARYSAGKNKNDVKQFIDGVKYFAIWIKQFL